MKPSEIKKQEAIVEAMTKLGNNPTPELPISSYLHLTNVLGELYEDAFKRGYRVRDGLEITKQIDNKKNNN